MCEQVFLTPYAEQELIDARSNHSNINNLQKARRFLVQSMMAINGVFGKKRGGFSYSDSYSRNGQEARVSRWNNLPDRLQLIVQRLKGIRIENKDARKLLSRYLNRPATLIYLDPPYFVDRTNGYDIDANDKKFHTELLRLANKSRCMIFISGYENELYNSMLSEKKGWGKKKIETTTKDSSGKSHNRTEVVWMNKHYLKALMLNKISLRLTKEELKQKKLNPERKR